MSTKKPLTKKQQDIIDRVAAGKSNAEIAEELNMEYANVSAHLGRAYDKLEIYGSTWDKRIKLINMFWKGAK